MPPGRPKNQSQPWRTSPDPEVFEDADLDKEWVVDRVVSEEIDTLGKRRYSAVTSADSCKVDILMLILLVSRSNGARTGIERMAAIPHGKAISRMKRSWDIGSVASKTPVHG